jgi:hypothetical protein
MFKFIPINHSNKPRRVFKVYSKAANPCPVINTAPDKHPQDQLSSGWVFGTELTTAVYLLLDGYILIIRA